MNLYIPRLLSCVILCVLLLHPHHAAGDRIIKPPVFPGGTVMALLRPPCVCTENNVEGLDQLERAGIVGTTPMVLCVGPPKPSDQCYQYHYAYVTVIAYRPLSRWAQVSWEKDPAHDIKLRWFYTLDNQTYVEITPRAGSSGEGRDYRDCCAREKCCQPRRTRFHSNKALHFGGYAESFLRSNSPNYYNGEIALRGDMGQLTDQSPRKYSGTIRGIHPDQWNDGEWALVHGSGFRYRATPHGMVTSPVTFHTGVRTVDEDLFLGAKSRINAPSSIITWDVWIEAPEPNHEE